MRLEHITDREVRFFEIYRMTSKNIKKRIVVIIYCMLCKIKGN